MHTKSIKVEEYMCFLHHSSFGFNVMCTFCIRNIDCNLLNQHNNCLQKLYKVYFFLDFLKVLRFSFPVPVVGPSAKTFIPCRTPNLQEEFSSCRFYPITAFCRFEKRRTLRAAKNKGHLLSCLTTVQCSSLSVPETPS